MTPTSLQAQNKNARSHEEIAAMRKPVDDLVALAEKMNYENLEDFANAVAGSIKYKMGVGH